jgi:hypothetical protein
MEIGDTAPMNTLKNIRRYEKKQNDVLEEWSVALAILEYCTKHTNGMNDDEIEKIWREQYRTNFTSRPFNPARWTVILGGLVQAGMVDCLDGRYRASELAMRKFATIPNHF